jgi:uncharacterized protein (DUF342 family)
VADFDDLRSVVKKRLDEDRNIKIVETEGPDLESAVSQAAELLGVPISRLGYEIIIQKSSFFGIGENICKIRAYALRSKNKKTHGDVDDVEDLELLEEKGSDVFIQRRSNGVYMKIMPQGGGSKPADMTEAKQALKKYAIDDYDVKLVEKAIREAAGEYIRVAGYKPIPEHNTFIEIGITDGELQAYMTVTPPGKGGVDFTYEEYLDYLSSCGIVKGISEDFLKYFADRPIYWQKVCVARGKSAINGMDAFIEYYFEVEAPKVRFKQGGFDQVDFKELNRVQNVQKGERLAKKNEAESGVPGYTVSGTILPATSGHDITLELGKNVSFDSDGLTVISDVTGQAMLLNGKISVELAHIVDSSVDLSTGNIMFLGNVIIKKNVEEGFYVKAAGNIEVHGFVMKASLHAGGNIIINKGVIGKEGATIWAKDTVYAKFIENANIEAEGKVIVSTGIINSQVKAGQSIVCAGKRAAIVGGKLCAGELIEGKVLGSPQGSTVTICEVGYDPFVKAKLEQYVANSDKLKAELDDILLNLHTLSEVKQRSGFLPEDKKEYFIKLQARKEELEHDFEKDREEIENLKNILKKMSKNGRVSAAAMIYPGVTICILNQKFVVGKEFQATSFVLDQDAIQAVRNQDLKITAE